MATGTEPSSVRRTLGLIQNSEYLGVVTANLARVLDANDAFLKMVGFSREEMEAGLLDWRAMTPPESRKHDDLALQQLIDEGASVPFEKEYLLRDGRRLPMLMGGIRLKSEPLEWMCYVVDLTDRKRADRAENQSRQLQAKQSVINQIAHELNNPLAALVFLIESLRMKVGSDNPEIREMFAQSSEMLTRMAALTRAVLAAAYTETDAAGK
jgi:PAS domain S-box-containing protein